MNAEPPNFTKVSGAVAFGDAALEAIQLARHDLALMTIELPRAIFGNETFVERLRTFILGHRRARLRVLVHDPATAVRNSVRLAEFGRLLSSRIEFREVPKARRQLREEYLVADERALLYRSAPEQIDGKFYADAPMVARSHLRAFDAVWQEAVVARELSGLGL